MQKMYQYKTPPFDHQRVALNKGALLTNFAYFMEMGTGKTKVVIDNAAYLYQQNEIKEVIVIAPNSVYRNWLAEISTHSPVDPYIWVWKVDKQRDLDKASRSNDLIYILVNVEAMSHRSGWKWLEERLRLNGSKILLTLDE